ncbi:MAG: hypothetical protein KF861_01825 [Planctomycetaceae bacterium]|nr:hypothetical protein [Planctomycetaceae bacterium]
MIELATRQSERRVTAIPVERLWLVPVLPSSELGPAVLKEGETRIGSDTTCDVCLPIDGVDAHHCTVRLDRGRAVLTAHSRMTWLNDGPVRQAVIRPGQRLAIGPVEFRIEQHTDPVSDARVFEPLEYVDQLRRIVGEELEAIQVTRPDRGLQPPNRMDMPVESRSTAAAPAVSSVGEQRSALVVEEALETRRTEQDLQRRRALIEEVQNSLLEQTITTLQAHKEQAEVHNAHRIELVRLRNELASEQAAVQAERIELASRDAEVSRRLSQLKEHEQAVCTRQAELEQSLSLIDEERKGQFHRETLLQRRIDEVNRAEVVLAEREVALRAGQQQLDLLQSRSAPPAPNAVVETAETADTWKQQQIVDAATIAELREELARKTTHIDQLQRGMQAAEHRLEEREADLHSREAALERRATELSQQRATTQERAIEMDARENSVMRQVQACKHERQSIVTWRDQLEQEGRATTALRDQLEQERQSIAVRHDQLAQDRVHLQGELEALSSRQMELQKQEEQVRRDRDELEQRARDVSTREASFDRREQDLTAQAAAAAQSMQTTAGLDQQTLEKLSQDLLQEQSRLHDQTQALREQQSRVEREREQIHADQQELQEQLAQLKASRIELREEWERVEMESRQVAAERERLEREVRERPAAAASAVPTHSDDRTDSLQHTSGDAYEMCDAPEEHADDLQDDLIADESEASDAVSDEAATGLRSQLAMLFGVSSDELNQRARKQPEGAVRSAPPATTHRNEAPAAPQKPEVAHAVAKPTSAAPVKAPVEDRRPQSPSSHHPSGEESAAEDSIAAYMEKLLARSRQGASGVRTETQTTPPPETRRAQPAPIIDAAAAAETSMEAPAIVSETESATALRKRPDTTLERANIDAFRDLANLSARSAVAKHQSSSLRNRFICLIITTAALFLTWLVMITAHLWVGASYVSWGLLCAAAMCVSALELLKTASRMQAHPTLEVVDPEADAQDPLRLVVRRLSGIARRLSPTLGRSEREMAATESQAGSPSELP